jgi:hypothetical protein
MKTVAFIAVSCALLLPAVSAGAGQCTSEIDSLARALATRDAGSGPTVGAAGSGKGQHPPTSAMSQADQGGAASAAAAQADRPQHPPTTAMTREATGSAGPSGETQNTEQHPPTAAMSRESQGAASPQDVQRQTQGQPTAAQQVQGQSSSSHDMVAATAELERARMHDQHGKEADCLSAVERAKLLAGSR